MGRRKTNRYRIVSDGLKIEKSLSQEWCQHSTEKDIIEAILISVSFFNVLNSYREGKREVKLVPIRVHEVEDE